MVGGKRKHHQEHAETGTRHVRSRLSHAPSSSATTELSLPLRLRLETSDLENGGVPSADAESIMLGIDAGSASKQDTEIHKAMTYLYLSRNQQTTKEEFLARIRQLTGLAPEDTLEKRFRPGYMAENSEWTCRAPADWGKRFLDQLARVFGLATPRKLNEWLDARVGARTDLRNGTAVHRTYLAAFRRERWEEARCDREGK